MAQTENNKHCFQGAYRRYWYDMARGLKPKQPSARNSHYGEYELDEFAEDGGIANNGGILGPEEASPDPNRNYYRFFSTASHGVYGDMGWLGNWWIDGDTYWTLVGMAQDSGDPLRKVVRREMAIPDEWGNDCAYVVRASYTSRMRAWAGRTKVAHGKGSPDAAKVKGEKGGLVGRAPHTALRQLFFPGSRKEIERFFVPLGIGRAARADRVQFGPIRKT